MFNLYANQLDRTRNKPNQAQEDKKIISNYKILKKDTNIKSENKNLFSLPHPNKQVSSETSETGISGLWRQAFPEGSRLLTINLMGGRITEKVYLMLNGEKLSYKGAKS